MKNIVVSDTESKRQDAKSAALTEKANQQGIWLALDVQTRQTFACPLLSDC